MIKFTQRLGALVLFYGIYISDANADQIVQDDQVVMGSSCIGTDCVNGESFGFDTIRVKENNVRIRFVDTSSSSSFPTIDWQLTANDSANGGLNKFSIDEIDSGKTPFTIIQSAPSNSLYIKDNGFVGFNTSTPVVNLHVKYGNSPALRLEQDSSSGFSSQAWDVAGNETNFFIRDVSNGSKIPFKIKPGATNDSIFVNSNGDVGFETSSPNGQFDVAHSANANNHAFLIDTNSYVGVNIDNNQHPLGLFDVHTATGKSGFVVQSNGNVGFGTGSSGVVGRFDVRSLDYANYYLNVDYSGDIGVGTSNPLGRFEITDAASSATPYFSVDGTGQVGIGVNVPTATLDITKADATMLVKDTFTAATADKDIRNLLTLESGWGSAMTFSNRTYPDRDWTIKTNTVNGSFQIAHEGADNGGSAFTLSDSALVVKDYSNNQLMVLNSSGLTINGTLASSSSRTVKNNIVAVDPERILEMLSELMIAKWNYTQDGADIKHIGPIAEEFYTLFGLGADDKHIASLDTSGVAIAAIQALNGKVKAKEEQIKKLEQNNTELNERLSAIESTIEKLNR